MRAGGIYFLIFGAFFLLRNILMPLAQDDYSYAFIWDGDRGGNFLTLQSESAEIERRERVDSFGDIIKSQVSHWFTWGGRTFAHSLAQFFIWIGKPYFDVANTLILAILVLTILKLAGVSAKNSAAVVWIFFNILFVAAESVVTILWLTGACNYLWMAAFQLIFLLPYVLAIRSKNFGGSGLKIFVMAVLGILAGWSNEAGALATVFLTAFLIFTVRRKNFVPRWMVAGFLAAAIGCALNILAPGNFAQVRFIQSVSAEFNYTPELFKQHLLGGFLPTVALDLVALLPLLYYFWRRGLRNLTLDEILILAFAAAGFLVPAAMIFSPKFDLRVSVVSMAFVLVPAAWACSKIKFNLPKKFIAAAATVIIFYAATLIYSDLSVYRAVQENLLYIRQHQNDNPVIMEPLNVSKIFEPIQRGKVAMPYIKYFGGINRDAHFYLNVMVAQYYGLKSIVAKGN